MGCGRSWVRTPTGALIPTCKLILNSEFKLNSVLVKNRPPAPSLCEVASHEKNSNISAIIIISTYHSCIIWNKPMSDEPRVSSQVWHGVTDVMPAGPRSKRTIDGRAVAGGRQILWRGHLALIGVQQRPTRSVSPGTDTQLNAAGLVKHFTP